MYCCSRRDLFLLVTQTHTTFGTAVDEGVLPRALRALLAHATCPIDDSKDLLLTITMGCILNEMFCDLLDTTHSKDDLRIKQSVTEGAYVQDITEVRIREISNALQIVEYGEII